jgi:hypothetical protein
MWSAKDNEALQKLLLPLNSPELRPEIQGVFGSEARGLISCPRSEVYDRATSFLATLNVTSALVLSCMAGLYTSPLDVDSLPQEKHGLGNLFNIIAYATVTIQVCIVMSSTYLLLFVAAHGHTSDIMYRALAHLGALFGSLQVGLYIPLMLWLILMVLSAHIHFSSSWVRWACTGVVISIYFVFHLLFTYSAARAFPRAMWGWLSITCPWLICDARVR